MSIPDEYMMLKLCLRRRSHKSRMARKKLRSQNEQMKALMSSLMTRKGEGGQHSVDQLMHAHELVFVMTDMEGSTAQASTNPAAFEKIQQVHDMVSAPSQPVKALPDHQVYRLLGHQCDCMDAAPSQCPMPQMEC